MHVAGKAAAASSKEACLFEGRRVSVLALTGAFVCKLDCFLTQVSWSLVSPLPGNSVYKRRPISTALDFKYSKRCPCHFLLADGRCSSFILMTVVRIRILRRVGADGQDAILDQYSRGACAPGKH